MSSRHTLCTNFMPRFLRDTNESHQRPKDIIRIAEDAGFEVRRKGTRLIIVDPKGGMLSISGHTNEDYDKGQAAAIRQWFRERNITIV